MGARQARAARPRGAAARAAWLASSTPMSQQPRRAGARPPRGLSALVLLILLASAHGAQLGQEPSGARAAGTLRVAPDQAGTTACQVAAFARLLRCFFARQG
jgi:hypothetical protein